MTGLYRMVEKLKLSLFWRILSALHRTILALSGGFVLVLVLLIVIMRYVFRTDLFGTEELVMAVAFWLFFSGAVNASMTDTQIKADIVSMLLKNRRVNALLALVSSLFELFVLVVFSYWSTLLVIENYTRWPATPALKIPLIVPQSAIVFGCVLMAFYVLVRCIELLCKAAGADETEEGGQSTCQS